MDWSLDRRVWVSRDVVRDQVTRSDAVVPEELNESSQARCTWEIVRQRTRPGGHGMIGRTW
jgi:hypothetical protein